ncbi:MAG: hypothetical protein NWE96_07705 [Candidatus Bathyarchaeota archaeon]|nr:hypothetical protein [Candidatus Bathyarchaeota archaeon]
MGKHRDRDTLEFIDWLKAKGESLGYIAELEYPLVAREYFVDVIWKLKKEQTPLMTFEVETKDNRSIFANTLKIYGTPTGKVPKPWHHFMIIYKGKLSEGHKDDLTNYIAQHNLFLFEDIYGNEENKRKLEGKLQTLSLKHNLSEQIKREMQSRPLGEALEEVVKGLSEGLSDGVLGKPEVSLAFKSTKPPEEGGIPFTITAETKKGEPTLLERLNESIKTLKPFTIESPQLKGLTMNGKSLIDVEKGKASLTFAPQPQAAPPVRLEVPGSDIAFDNVHLWRTKSEGTVNYLSSQDRNLPFIFNFIVDAAGKSNKFNFEFETEKADVKQAYQFQELISAINKHKRISLVNPKDNKPLLIFQMRDTFEQSEDWRYLLSKLAYIQEKINHRIQMPKKITQEDIKDIFTAIRVIDTGEDSGQINEITMGFLKQGTRQIIDIQKKQGKISQMKVTQTTTLKLFDEEIPFGKNTIDLPDMQFALPIDEVERLADAQTDGSTLNLVLKPVGDKSITLKFEDWPKKPA